MILRITLALVTLFILWAGSSFAQPRAYIPSINDGTVTVMDVSTNTVIDVLNVGDRPSSTAVTPDGTKVYVPRNGPGRVVVIETSTNTVLTTLNVGGSPSDVAITPDGSFAYVSDFDNRVLVIDTATDMVVDTIPFNITLSPGAILVTPDGAYAYVLITNTNQSLRRIDTATNTVLGTNLSGFGNGTHMDISPAGNKLYITVRSGLDVDGVQIVDIDMAGVPSLGTFVSLEFTDCILAPNHVAVHPNTNQAWVVTTPSDAPFTTCGAMDPFRAQLVLINPDDSSLLIGGIPQTFSRLGFTRDGATAFYTTFMNRSVTSLAMLPIMLGMQTIIGAAFPRSPYFIGPPMSELTVTKTGNGDGNVTSMNPAGMNCDSSMNEMCDIAVPTGMEVTLTVTPDASSIFNGWGGDCSGMGAQTMITVSADSECTAEFTSIQFNVDVSINPPGGGSVTTTPMGINCPGTCSQLFNINSNITFNEMADPDFNFVNWTGDDDCTDGVIQDLTADTSCTANFDIKKFTVTVNLAGSGGGTVTSAPVGINCPGDCSEIYIIHTAVTLTAVPDAVSMPAVWSPNCPGGVIADLTEDTVCTATFDFLPLLLTPIFPGIKSNVNTMTSSNATPGGLVVFVWGFQPGSFIVGGAMCAGVELGISPPQLLGIVTAGGNGVAELVFFVPSLGNTTLVFTQALDIGTCRVSEVVPNILRSN